ncbi:Glucuronoxylan 4-O-methyltransferase 3 [Stylosanthes scabra]|uniref:Glucuronoxylan 4-O-methyltransferase 3 n=1 Tax=Stylosanthes scabra TaxID=79078 RepID=A0ABU6Y597_9FABA|nr:Glucuronoxylan 4-O-methyltransferase 3 [Stylosanthes scabra]
MRSKTQFTGTLKVSLLCLGFLVLFALIFRSTISSFNSSSKSRGSSSTTEQPTTAAVVECPSLPLTPTCSKAPPSLANAVIHYATTNITPQQTLEEISVSARVLQKKSPCNFLVFGLGHDSLMWTSLNYGGRTVFLEEDKAWIDQVQQRIPGLESYHVAYDTKVHEADDLIKIGMEEDECKKVSDPRLSKCQLAHKGFPSEVYDIEWDVIMVDAPTGYFEGAPGRMSAIYTAGLIARNKEQGDTDVFVHDVDRKVEDSFSKAFLCHGYLREQQGRIRHFTIPSHRARLGRPFCPS